MAKHIFIYHDITDDSYGGARINNLAFFDSTNNEIPITDIKRGSGNTVEFKLKGVNARVEIINPYSDASYPLIRIFNKGTGYSNATMTVTKNTLHVYFDENVNGIAYVTLLSTYQLANNWHIEVDNKLINIEPVTTTLDEVFKLPMPPSLIRCAIKKDGKYLFLKPEDKR